MKKTILYVTLLILSIIIFTLLVIFNAKGIFGLIGVLLSIYLFLGSIIKLCKSSKKFKNGFLNFIDLLFWLP